MCNRQYRLISFGISFGVWVNCVYLISTAVIIHSSHSLSNRFISLPFQDIQCSMSVPVAFISFEMMRLMKLMIKKLFCSSKFSYFISTLSIYLNSRFESILVHSSFPYLILFLWTSPQHSDLTKIFYVIF